MVVQAAHATFGAAAVASAISDAAGGHGWRPDPTPAPKLLGPQIANPAFPKFASFLKRPRHVHGATFWPSTKPPLYALESFLQHLKLSVEIINLLTGRASWSRRLRSKSFNRS